MSEKGAKRMKGDGMMGCRCLGRGVRRVGGHSLSVGCVPKQRTLAMGEGDAEGRKITYLTIM